MACVYWIRHPDHTDLFTQGYIGFTSVLPRKRWNCHKHIAKKNKANYPICNAIRKYGDELIFKILVIGEREYCLDLEKKLRPKNEIGWNLGIGGEAPSLGRKATQAERDYHSKIRKGRKRSEAWKKLMSKKLKGRTTIGRPHSAETKKKISESNKGKIRSKEHSQKIADANRGRKCTEEAKLKMSLARKGRKASAETREKISKSLTGKKHVIVTCPYCRVSGGKQAMMQWHFDKCGKKKYARIRKNS